MTDAQLLADYIHHTSQEAFATLVHRYINIVYAAARRQVTDPGLAQDITQAVFLLLSQRAKTIRNPAALPAWLLQTTRYAAADARKARTRRQHHEQQAAAMKPESTPSPDAADSLWHACAPAIDQALARLPEIDRAAIILRYLRDLPLREVGQSLNLSEEAARKRVDRGIIRLRELLAAQAPSLSASSLALALLTHGSAPAPATLAQAILCASPAATSSATAIAVRTAHTLAWAKAKAAAVIIAAITTATTTAILAVQTTTAPSPAAPPAASRPAIAATLPATKPTLPPDLAAALSRIPQQFQTITLEWEQTRALNLPPDQAVKQLGFEPYMVHILNTGATYRLSADNGQIYVWRKMDQAIPPAPPRMDVFEVAFDGQTLAIGSPEMKVRGPRGDEPAPSLQLYDIRRFAAERPAAAYIESQHLDAVGIMLPSRLSDLAAHQKPTSRILQLLQGDGELLDVQPATLDGQTLLLVRILAPNEQREAMRRIDLKSYEAELRSGRNSEQMIQTELSAIQTMWELPEKWVHHFYLDPAHAYMLRRYERHYQDGKLLTITDCTDPQPFGQTWLPRKCVIQAYWYPPDHYFDQPVTTQTLTLKSATLDRPAPTTFRLNYTAPGTHITDYTGPQPQTRTIR